MFILSMFSQNTAQHRILWDIDAKITKIIYLHNFVIVFSKQRVIYYNISYSSVEKSISGASVTLPVRSNQVPDSRYPSKKPPMVRKKPSPSTPPL